jgi:DNA-binding Xre family transcriptional regulator
MVTIDWRLSELMRMRGIRSTAALRRRLAERRGEVAGLSQAQVYRLTEGRSPELLNLETLGALCTALDTTPAELLTSDIDGVPNPVLDILLGHFAMATAHYKLCGYGRAAGGTDSMMGHPGDPFGTVVAWLWRSGRGGRAAQLVADYMAEMRVYNPHRPAEGDMLTWTELRNGIRMAINTPYQLTTDEVDELCASLDVNVPIRYGKPLAELEQP